MERLKTTWSEMKKIVWFKNLSFWYLKTKNPHRHNLLFLDNLTKIQFKSAQ